MSSSTTSIIDLIIVGAGPAGISVAIAAQKAGLKHLILEKGPIVNSIYNFPQKMTFFSTSEKLEVGGVPFISHNDKPTRAEALEYYRRLVKTNALNIQTFCEVKAISKKEQTFHVQTTKGVFNSQSVVLATGFYGNPRKIEVPGESLQKVKHYYDDPHLYINQNVLVIGAANSACDVALETWMKGANVSMAIRGSEIYQKVKYWIKPNIENRIAEGSIKAYFNTTVREIRAKEVVLNTPEGDKTIANDFVLAMTGYQPNYDFLHACGIVTKGDKKVPQFDPETLESTDVPGMYLAGVINAGLGTSTLFIENTRHHGDQIVRDIMAKRRAPVF